MSHITNASARPHLIPMSAAVLPHIEADDVIRFTLRLLCGKTFPRAWVKRTKGLRTATGFEVRRSDWQITACR